MADLRCTAFFVPDARPSPVRVAVVTLSLLSSPAVMMR
jgi:hypothetical protein